MMYKTACPGGAQGQNLSALCSALKQTNIVFPTAVHSAVEHFFLSPIYRVVQLAVGQKMTLVLPSLDVTTLMSALS